MTTLQRIAPLVARLFTAADATTQTLRAEIAKMAPGELDAALGNPDYVGFYTRMKDVHLAVSRETATLLYLLVRAAKARTVVEFGTSFAISTLHLAAAIVDNGGGRVIGSEFEPGKVAAARATIAEAGLAEVVEIRAGDALETLARDLPDSIDVVLFDGAKPLYPRIHALLATRHHAGSLLLADNADAAPDYLATVRGPGYVSVPFAEDVELSLKL
jgi:predicted O-methyltransferase YrrM